MTHFSLPPGSGFKVATAVRKLPRDCLGPSQTGILFPAKMPLLTVLSIACLLLSRVDAQNISTATSVRANVSSEDNSTNDGEFVSPPRITVVILEEEATVAESPSPSTADASTTEVSSSESRRVEEKRLSSDKTPPEATTTLSPELEATKKWERMEESLKDLIASVMKSLLPRIMKASENVKISRNCMNGLFQLISGIRQMKPWAFYMLDAMSKPLAGTLAGTISSFGSFDECLDIVVNEGRRNEFYGQYCAMEIRPPLPPKPRYYKMRDTLPAFANFSTQKDTVIRDISKIAHFFYSIPFRMDLCVPSLCSKEDVSKIVGAVLSGDTITAEVTRCELKEEWSLDKHQFAIICMFGVIGLAVAIGSVLEAVYLLKGESPHDFCHKSMRAKILLSFSVYSNTRRLFKTSVAEERLTVIYGLKALTMMWLIWSNVYFATERICFSTLRQMTEFPKSGLFQALINSSLSFDNLYFTSAVIIAYMNVKYVKKFNKKFSVVPFILKRIWRTIPSLMLLIAVSLLVPIIGSGPLWKEVMETHVNKCKDYWWTNLLLINNFYPKPSENCFAYSPYYAGDVQLYIASALVFLPLLKYKSVKTAIFFIFAFIIGSVIATCVVTHVYNLPPTMLFTYLDPEDQDEVMHLVFLKPFSHMGAFFIGIALGWFLYEHRDLEFKWKYHFIGWPSALTASMAVLFGVHQWNLGNVPNDSVSSLYSGFHRTVWSLTLAWFTAVCFYGAGGVFRKIFTWKALVPLSRMTFLAFIVHYIILLIICGFLRERIQPNHTIAVFLACGLYVLTYFISYVCYISFDGPVESLKSLIFDTNKKEAVEIYVNGTHDTHVKDAEVKSYDLYKVHSHA